MSEPELPIRPLETLDEYRACVALQEKVWGEGFSERVPPAILQVSQRLGGLVAGSWSADGELAGFVFGMTGVEDGRVVHWSDMLAVRPGERNAGLGARLKAYQRKVLLDRGIDTVYWSFEPLESKNAHLNFSKLGVVVREYEENMYGETDSPLHRGLGTDRFIALWLLDSPRVRGRLAGTESPPAPGTVTAPSALDVERDDGEPVPRARDVPPDAERLLVPIPARIHDLKARHPGLARRWREATRTALVPRLAHGYEVRELLHEPGEELSHYLLVRTGA